MAKRKRLELPADPVSFGLETKSAFPPALGPAAAPATRARMPIAEVARDTAARAALEEVAAAMTEAEEEGRVVRRLKLSLIDIHHLNRDRMVLEAEEMAVLRSSIAERGQQTPVEVLQLSAGRFGLISGLRRIVVLKELGAETCLALVRRPETAEAAYVAMIEENEIRADVSFYERANIAVQAVGAGVYRDPRAAVRGLYGRSPAAKRSKILKFVTLRQTLGKMLAFPAAIPEKLGLALATAIEADRAVAARIGDALRKTPPADAAAERRVLERALRNAGAGAAETGEEIAPGIRFQARRGRAVLSGPGVDADLARALRDWIAAR